MYQPSHFTQTDRTALLSLISEHPFATLMHHHPSGALDADHLPMLWDAGPAGSPAGTLLGHVARANPLWQAAQDREVLVAFQGLQAYVSPSWYETKRSQDGKVVPTWNYCVVHARGVLRCIEESAELLALLHRLTDTHEGGRSHPWSVHDAPAGYIEGMMRAIVGIRIELSSLEGKWKLSQNRPAADRTGVIAGLSGEHSESARRMSSLIPPATGA
jgi:transcriptional regulator